MSYREWWTLAEMRHHRQIASANRFDHDSAEEFEQYLRENGAIE